MILSHAGTLARAVALAPRHTAWHQHELEQTVLGALQMLVDSLDGTDLQTELEDFVDRMRKARENNADEDSEAAARSDMRHDRKIDDELTMGRAA